MKKSILLLASALLLGGCNGIDRLLGNNDPGTPVNPSQGVRAPDANATPIYDQSTATAAQDDAVILHVIGDTSTAAVQSYLSNTQAATIGHMNGIHNLAPGIAYNSLLIDAEKALFRRGYYSTSGLNNPGILSANSYPVPVYQGDASAYGL